MTRSISSLDAPVDISVDISAGKSDKTTSLTSAIANPNSVKSYVKSSQGELEVKEKKTRSKTKSTKSSTKSERKQEYQRYYQNKPGDCVSFHDIWLPYFSLAGEKTGSKKKLPYHEAIEESYISPDVGRSFNANSRYDRTINGIRNIITIDCDHTYYLDVIAKHFSLPTPAFIVINPETKQAHLSWVLANPVHLNQPKSRDFLRCITLSLQEIFNADTRFTGRFIKNPLHPHYQTLWADYSVNPDGSLDSGTYNKIILTDLHELFDPIKKMDKVVKSSTRSAKSIAHEIVFGNDNNKESQGKASKSERSPYYQTFTDLKPRDYDGRNNYLYDYAKFYARDCLKDIDVVDDNVCRSLREELVTIVDDLQNNSEYLDAFGLALPGSEVQCIIDNAMKYGQKKGGEVNSEVRRCLRAWGKKGGTATNAKWGNDPEFCRRRNENLLKGSLISLPKIHQRQKEQKAQRLVELAALKEEQQNALNDRRSEIVAQYVSACLTGDFATNSEVRKYVKDTFYPDDDTVNQKVITDFVHENSLLASVDFHPLDALIVKTVNDIIFNNPLITTRQLTESLFTKAQVNDILLKHRKTAVGINSRNITALAAAYHLITVKKLNPMVDEDEINDYLYSQEVNNARRKAIIRGVQKIYNSDNSADDFSVIPSISLREDVMAVLQQVIDAGTVNKETIEAGGLHATIEDLEDANSVPDSDNNSDAEKKTVPHSYAYYSSLNKNIVKEESLPAIDGEDYYYSNYTYRPPSDLIPDKPRLLPSTVEYHKDEDYDSFVAMLQDHQKTRDSLDDNNDDDCFYAPEPPDIDVPEYDDDNGIECDNVYSFTVKNFLPPDNSSLHITNKQASELRQQRLEGLTPALLVENFTNDKTITDKLVRELVISHQINLYNSASEKLDTSASNSLYREGIVTFIRLSEVYESRKRKTVSPGMIIHARIFESQKTLPSAKPSPLTGQVDWSEYVNLHRKKIQDMIDNPKPRGIPYHMQTIQKRSPKKSPKSSKKQITRAVA